MSQQHEVEVARPEVMNDIPIDEKVSSVKYEVEHVEGNPTAVDTGLKFRSVQEQAFEGDSFEASLTILQAVKLYRKAVFWAFIASLSIIMEGYDFSVTGSYTALPTFREYFGKYYPEIHQWQIPAQWQTALSQASLLGQYMGIPFGSWLVERIGYRYSLMINYVLIIPFIAVQAWAKNLPQLFAGTLLAGIPFGVFSTLACGYASEVTPVRLRGYLTGWINFCWVLGLLFGTGIANAILRYTEIIGFRIGYMTQWTWPFILFPLIYLAPDAPWWLIRKNRTKDAETAMKRLTSPRMHEQIPSLVQSMVRTYQFEIDVSSGSRWIDCFKGPDRRRTEIACMAFACQSLCGDPFTGNVIYFLQSAGMVDDLAFLMGLINWVIIFFGCVGGYIALTFVGRRKLYCFGMGAMTIGLLIIGALQKGVDHRNSSYRWGIVGVIFTWNTLRVITIGPVCYVVVSESSSSRLRNKTIGLARISYQIVGLIVNFFQPWLINPSALNLKGYTAFVWAPICFVGWLWCYFRLPEFKDRSYYELDVLFERRISSKKFAQTNVEALADDHIREEHQIAQHI